MIVLAGSRRCSWSLTAVALRLFFLPVNPVFIRIKDLVQSDRALALALLGLIPALVIRLVRSTRR